MYRDIALVGMGARREGRKGWGIDTHDHRLVTLSWLMLWFIVQKMISYMQSINADIYNINKNVSIHFTMFLTLYRDSPDNLFMSFKAMFPCENLLEYKFSGVSRPSSGANACMCHCRTNCCALCFHRRAALRGTPGHALTRLRSHGNRVLPSRILELSVVVSPFLLSVHFRFKFLDIRRFHHLSEHRITGAPVQYFYLDFLKLSLVLLLHVFV